ncbi:hypothetical protein WN55_07616 [Dufourea novaeangliae]|uniref:Uncharacterized protein n=1 Tax=Dufourea novaeangliae TaxID=178035 RepID=A0A154PUK0_DUFNO|nr:hypothetical protein WN55_07616 [Dufourea novaeangliae]
MVISNRNLSQVDKMQYLCSALKGEAKAAITYLPITDANFEIAWKIVHSRYANKRRLINAHLNALFTLPYLATESPKEMRALRDRLNGAIQALKILERPVDSWSDVLVYIGVQRLDPASRKAWELTLGNATDFPTFQEYDAFLESRIGALDFIVPLKSEKPIKPKLLSAHVASSATITCPVCKGNHLLYKCTNFSSNPRPTGTIL